VRASKWLLLVLFVASVGSVAGPLQARDALSAPNAPDLTIKTHRTLGDPNANHAVHSETIYLKGARQRHESTYEWPGAPDRPAPPSFVQIVQCDEHRTLMLNEEAHLYAYEPMPTRTSHLSKVVTTNRAATITSPGGRELPIGGVTTITVDGVDTGERRTYGRYTARHVVTTTTTAPGPGATTPAKVETEDGWYIDLPPRDCVESDTHIVGSVLTMVNPARRTIDRIEFKQRGTARRGYPIEETQRIQSADMPAGFVSKIELVDVSDRPLDDELFTVPEGYRPALPRPYANSGHDMMKPDTFMNRVESYKEAAAMWVDGWTQYFFGRSYGHGVPYGHGY
jgi:hypothetical protein